jgi:hypothetical protein
MMRIGFLVLASVVLVLPACDGTQSEAKYPTGAERGSNEDIYAKPESIFGPGGLSFGNKDDKRDLDGIVVNRYLWRAALDTISFMPLASADPFGGVILTDWYTAPDASGERLKVNVFVTGGELRSEGLTLRVFKERKAGNAWESAPADPATARALEDAILARARQLRLAEAED